MRFESRSFDPSTVTSDDGVPPPVALRLVRGDLDVHPEDAFLREFRAFLRTTLLLGRAERRVADELARAALDQIDGPDGDFARMAVDTWLVAAMPSRLREGISHDAFGQLALAFVTFLRATDRVLPAGARRLRRAIAGLDGQPRAHAA